MSNNLKFYIDGAWVDPIEPRSIAVINPATEESAATISLGSAADVDRAVKAARAAFPAYSRSSKAERIALLQRVIEAYKARYDDIAKAISMASRSSSRSRQCSATSRPDGKDAKVPQDSSGPGTGAAAVLPRSRSAA